MQNKFIVGVFALLTLISVFFLFRLKFSFDFEQFFPTGDKELEFYRNFVKDFETDDNFFLVAIDREEGVFDQAFLQNFHEFTLDCQSLPYIKSAQSITKFAYPIKTPFSITTIPAIHIDDPSRYAEDRARVLKDERLVHNFISEDGKTLVVFLKTDTGIQLEQATIFVNALKELFKKHQFSEAQTHCLGRAYFQKEVVEMEKREVAMSTIIAGFLVTLIMAWIFKRFWGAFIALISILMSLIIFVGILGATGREMSALSALYPVLILILGTFDTIHIMSKYIDERQKGATALEAVRITRRDMALATFLTYFTTAIGFLTVMISNIKPIQDFGLNATIGLTVAYAVAMFFTPALISFFELDQLIKFSKESDRWKAMFDYLHEFTKTHRKGIAWASVAIFAISLYGISKITTNYHIEHNLPIGSKITKDFKFFEAHFSGFRPFELAITAKGDGHANDYEVVREMDKIEQHLRTYDCIRAVSSITTIYKSINQMNSGDALNAYHLAENKEAFDQASYLAAKLPQSTANVLLSKDKKKARIATRIKDLGADTVKRIGYEIDTWIAANIDTNLLRVQRTGTGLLLDKNSEYVRNDTILGIFISVGIISILMAFVLKNVWTILIFLIPNLLPLVICGAFMGFAHIELEAGVAIVFDVIFGIAVDDTIHTISKFRVFLKKGLTVDDALYETLHEVGKPMFQTALILFFGFLVMLFSASPPSINIGLLMSFTLISALASDVFLLPVLVRWLLKDKQQG
jgi:uncharacterized protein